MEQVELIRKDLAFSHSVYSSLLRINLTLDREKRRLPIKSIHFTFQAPSQANIGDTLYQFQLFVTVLPSWSYKENEESTIKVLT